MGSLKDLRVQMRAPF
jgi:SAM-dependent methyltransferase